MLLSGGGGALVAAAGDGKNAPQVNSGGSVIGPYVWTKPTVATASTPRHLYCLKLRLSAATLSGLDSC